MVRLKVYSSISLLISSNISIPYGAIKSLDNYLTNKVNKNISIPYGAIKRFI